jgi:large subunit ribosomal protein L23
MALLDIFKNKKGEKPGKRVSAKPAEKKEKTSVAKEEIIKIEKIEPVPKKRTSENAYRLLLSPHITEKATVLAEANKYVFKVFPEANKSEIKKAVENIYGVNVKGVRVLNVLKKKRRVGRQTGWTKGYKKAIVEVKQGQKIEILPR